MTKPSDDVVDKMLDNMMLNMDHRMDMMLVLMMSYKNFALMKRNPVELLDDFLMNYLELNKLNDKMEVVNTYNMKLEDRMMTLVEYRRMSAAFEFVSFVVDNGDDENDLVQILFQLIHEYAKLN
jgi:hypothetical protein